MLLVIFSLISTTDLNGTNGFLHFKKRTIRNFVSSWLLDQSANEEYIVFLPWGKKYRIFFPICALSHFVSFWLINYQFVKKYIRHSSIHPSIHLFLNPPVHRSSTHLRSYIIYTSINPSVRLFKKPFLPKRQIIFSFLTFSLFT